MADRLGKRLDNLSGDMPAPEAARRVLKARLKAVEYLLPLAAHCADQDDEHVHQLRVATRRADAAVRTFRRFCGHRRSRKMRRALRSVRRAAGLARECDVHTIMLADLRGGALAAWAVEVDDLLAWTARHRQDAQRAVIRQAGQQQVRLLKRRRRSLLRSARHIQKVQTFGELAQSVLEDDVGRLRESMRDDLSVPENMHRLRIRGKRLRYAVEIFACCLDGGARETLRFLKNMQDTLGAVNDYEGLVRWIVTAWREDPAHSGGVMVDGLTSPRSAVLQSVRAICDQNTRQCIERMNGGRWAKKIDQLPVVVVGSGTR